MCVHVSGEEEKKATRSGALDLSREGAGRFRGKKKKEYRETGGILRRRRAVAYEAQAESDHPEM